MLLLLPSSSSSVIITIKLHVAAASPSPTIILMELLEVRLVHHHRLHKHGLLLVTMAHHCHVLYGTGKEYRTSRLLLLLPVMRL